MRWQLLFNDLEDRFDDLARLAELGEMPDRERHAYGATLGVERLRGAIGLRLRVRTRTAGLAGQLMRVGPDWLLLEESPGRELLIPLSSVMTVEGLTARTGEPSTGIGDRLDLRFALRGLARDRCPMSVFTGSGVEVSGTIDRVGADWFELALHAPWEMRRAQAVRATILVPLHGLDHLRAVPLL